VGASLWHTMPALLQLGSDDKKRALLGKAFEQSTLVIQACHNDRFFEHYFVDHPTLPTPTSMNSKRHHQ